jgi:hypothetical protein
MKNIGIYLMGGLGNQVFQYLHAVKLKDEGCAVYLFADWFFKQHPSETTIRELLMHRFPRIEIPIVQASDFLEGGYMIMPFGQNHNHPKLIQYECGYFQNLSEIASKERLQNIFSNLPKNNKFIGLTAMHIRLGDFVKLGWSLPIWYYENILNNNPDTVFVIFSENQAETVSFLRQIKYRNYIFASEVDGTLQDDPISNFIALGSSKILYGANSTYSYLSGLSVGFNGGSYVAPDHRYWNYGNFDSDKALTGKSLFDFDFISRIN